MILGKAFSVLMIGFIISACSSNDGYHADFFDKVEKEKVLKDFIMFEEIQKSDPYKYIMPAALKYRGFSALICKLDESSRMEFLKRSKKPLVSFSNSDFNEVSKINECEDYPIFDPSEILGYELRIEGDWKVNILNTGCGEYFKVDVNRDAKSEGGFANGYFEVKDTGELLFFIIIY